MSETWDDLETFSIEAIQHGSKMTILCYGKEQVDRVRAREAIAHQQEIANLKAKLDDDPPSDILDEVHAIFTLHGIASRTDFPRLAGAVVSWAAKHARRAIEAHAERSDAALREAHQEMKQQTNEYIESCFNLSVKLDAAEARATQAEESLAAVTEQRDNMGKAWEEAKAHSEQAEGALRQLVTNYRADGYKALARAEAAEARLATLTAAYGQLRETLESFAADLDRCGMTAWANDLRAVLSTPETPSLG